MSTSALIQKITRWGRKNGVSVRVKKHESKGSHRRVYVGDRNTTVPWKDDLTVGVVHAILKQLGIDGSF